PEHRETEVDEDQERHGEQRALDGGHTRSSAQIMPNMRTAKATTPSTARKSATGPLSRRTCEESVKCCAGRINKV
ncbi:MAG: hypothetical protein ABSA08_08890, partial [Acidimicrobiales bacterium]